MTVGVDNKVTLKFNVKVNDVPDVGFNLQGSVMAAHSEDGFLIYVNSPTECTNVAAQAAPWNFGAGWCRQKFTAAQYTLTNNGKGNYTVVIDYPAAVAAIVPIAPATTVPFPTTPSAGMVFQVTLANSDNLYATFSAAVPAAAGQVGTPSHNVVSDAACIACHGLHVWRGDNGGVAVPHDATNPQGMTACIFCHARIGSNTVPNTPGAGNGFMSMIHGIHNSENMPTGKYFYYWSGAPVPQPNGFTIGFPSYMNNCNNCHNTADGVVAAATATVNWQNCMSCHQNWDGFTGTVVGGPYAAFHRSLTALTPATTCAGCHNDSIAPATIAGFHNGLKTERGGLLWDGADQSVVEGKRIDMQITGVTISGTNLVVTWTAKLDGAAVDPCNATATAGAPAFHAATANALTGQTAGSFSFLQGSAQADDWVNAGRTGTQSPGQPYSVNLTTTNTVCAANVATSTIANGAYTVTGDKGIVALQGRAQSYFAPAAGTVNEVILVRSKDPTYEYKLTDGTAATPRRAIVDSAKCLNCHEGSLYQHGGNRIDNVNLCVVCHNPAANEGNVRQGFGVTAEEAYDGKPGEAYDMRNFIHALHAGGETDMPIVIYRTRGIYFFGSQAALANYVATRNWPTSGGISCNGAEGPVTYYIVYGSSATGNVPEANPDGTCKTTGLLPSTNGTWQTHTATIVDYPSGLNRCDACHASTWRPATVDPTKGVAVTVDPGVGPFGNQLNDVLWGPSGASCMSCHQSGVQTTQFGLRIHNYGQAWVPTTFPNGRQTIIDAGAALPYP